MIIELIPGLEIEVTNLEVHKSNLSKYTFLVFYNTSPFQISLKEGLILKCKYNDIDLCNNFQVSDTWNLESENKLVLCGEEI